MSIVPLDVLDKTLIQSQSQHKENASAAALKHNSKFRKQTPLQNFSVGDLVMLRNLKTKNNPRETFIVEQLPSDDLPFILVRKLRNSLRSRLYKVLPDELLPIQDLSKGDATFGESSDHKSTVKTTQKLVTNGQHSSSTPRPTRKSAVQARKLIATCINAVYSKKSLFKHGWIEKDQIIDDIIFPAIDNCED